jgi:uncharacterized PurR-regulated membrane protein YhhQ (DUF165 family)
MIPFINWSFENLAFLNVSLPDNGVWNAMSIIVGLVLVVRDFAQREIGHYIFIPLLIALYLSYIMAPPVIALASGLAFLVSECVDWLVYSFTKKPLSTRILISSAAGVPVDTIVFLYFANMALPGFGNIWTFGTMLLSKFIGVVFVYFYVRKREAKETIVHQAQA